MDDSYSKHVLDFPKWMIMEQWLAKSTGKSDRDWMKGSAGRCAGLPWAWHGFCAEEVVEFVDSLQNPKKYQQLGDWEDWESSEVQEAVEQCWIIFFDAEFLQL